ncbi:mitogen-activated protein kinase kinase kinase [Malassezia japonica]|uniref:Mitogen-activated protein kinase kinase kinase n=1 Tax=Malassezia japonica TaxID=223818 RepID=A0AAF0EZR0_9BASI|nr:mitogen-activated protein kinase kinase kinase [Malassezia japonica]WFD37181.1 mitogen-activated protein kinase kinase kinase [Malassezia japonica]
MEPERRPAAADHAAPASRSEAVSAAERTGYFTRMRATRARPVETPAQMSTPQAEQGVFENFMFDDDPNKRMEWQTMLRSVLESEVLSSETKRIASADENVPSPGEFMYRIWLKLRAVHYGNIEGKLDADMERQVLKEIQRQVIPTLIDDILAAREFGAPDDSEPATPTSSSASSTPTVTRTAPTSPVSSRAESEVTVQATAIERAAVMAEVEALLSRVDVAESLFPSQRQMVAEYPAWGSPKVQKKLAALYSWYNVTRSLQAQVKLLPKWTGSLTDPGGVVRVPSTGSLGERRDDRDGERSDQVLVEGIFRESNLQQTFERRTLRALNQLVFKAKDAMAEHHAAFRKMRLPSFEPDVLPLVHFPMWLAEGALRQRLEYADKLKEPSVVLVESLSEDLRTAIALACRIKLQYTETTVSDPEHGWDLPIQADDAFDSTVCSALVFFFRLLHFRLKSAIYFKEVDLLEPEWDFLCSAVKVIPGGDAIVAHKTAYMVNRLFVRIITYFQRELQAPSAGHVLSPKAATRSAQQGPSTGGRLTEGRVAMSLQEMTRWIHTVFNTERVRSRKLIGFARKVRSRLENAAEYDLRSLKVRSDAGSDSTPSTQYDLHRFLQTLLHADYFLVYTSTFEERGIYVLADPSLHDQPDSIQELMFTCIRQTRRVSRRRDDGLHPDTPTRLRHRTRPPPSYLLLLSPREPFLWTGRVMTLPLPWINVDLKEQRLRLVADGTHDRLHMCKNHFQWQFASASTRSVQDYSSPPPSGVFPLTTVYEQMAHLSMIQHELKLMNKGGYVLTDTVLHAVPAIRRQMVRLRSPAPMSPIEASPVDRASCDELVQTCFGIAVDQGARALVYMESTRLRSQISAALAQLAIEWISFICDDCVLTERKTFKWAVAALENAMQMTRGEKIFLLNENEYNLLKGKVSSCIALLISHFDILGARSTAAQAEEEQKRFERKKLARARECELQIVNEPATLEDKVAARRLASCAMHDEERQNNLNERRAVGRVLDDTLLEDRGLQLLASKGVQMRWQQGRFIGGGTFGTVYLAVNLDTGGLMAVKEIRFQELSSTPSLYKQIHDEMNVMEMLRHPNIVEYYGIEVHRDKVYIFEEYCQGGSMAQLLEHGRIEDEIVLQVYSLQMLDGLMYLHSKGVVHRDIKPENILLDHMGVIKFVDFGAAKVLSSSSRTVQRSRKAGVLPVGGGMDAAGQSLQGTPMYMSPEVIKGEQNGRQGAMDVWSLGCVILECATGSRPWSHLDNEWAIMFHIGMAQQHPPLPDETQLSALGIDFIRQCLIIDPFERPTAIELRGHAWIRELVDELNAEGELDGAEPGAPEAAEEVAEEHEEEEPMPIRPPSAALRTERFDQKHYARAQQEASRELRQQRDPVPELDLEHDSDASGQLVPGHPDHSHPGYEALIADKQYRKEEEEIKAMLEPDSPYSTA